MTYVDTSGLVKLLIAEAETAALGEYLSEAPDRPTSSELSIAEVTRTVARAGVGAAAAGLLLRQLDLLTIDEASLWRAGRLPSPAGTFLRTADAIHLVAAMELGESEFLTYDRRQAQAAADRGFAVIAPGQPKDWYLAP
ncbi:type II toxin-antitoxin system VapC family toxin [Kineosporia sp. J2-2]|uniref:Ribonuclease VapC n=1 Tax=Kineosporia corallincola TaxID=2835133 RepID=A0ABS5TR92_9ACTN|nr:type II toxin-antitoxin system VapC family toxin [Kineosporia corallincola]MBT0772929.1 type II toxin-antitoxin system VapC family toxin [Kineosporia corallincola]